MCIFKLSAKFRNLSIKIWIRSSSEREYLIEQRECVMGFVHAQKLTSS